MRLQQVAAGECKPRRTGGGARRAPAAWETRQLQQFGQTMQLSCNPAKYFVIANDQVQGSSPDCLAGGLKWALPTHALGPCVSAQCPLAFRAIFPCVPGTLDYAFCTGDKGGMVIPGEEEVTPYHGLCISHVALRTTFECEKVRTGDQTRRPAALL